MPCTFSYPDAIRKTLAKLGISIPVRTRRWTIDGSMHWCVRLLPERAGARCFAVCWVWREARSSRPHWRMRTPHGVPPRLWLRRNVRAGSSRSTASAFARPTPPTSAVLPAAQAYREVLRDRVIRNAATTRAASAPVMGKSFAVPIRANSAPSPASVVRRVGPAVPAMAVSHRVSAAPRQIALRKAAKRQHVRKSTHAAMPSIARSRMVAVRRRSAIGATAPARGRARNRYSTATTTTAARRAVAMKG